MANLTLMSGKVMEQILLKSTYGTMEDKMVKGSSRHGFTKGKSCLTNLRAFCNEKTGAVDEESAVMFISFSARLSTLSHIKQQMEVLDKWTDVGCENWLTNLSVCAWPAAQRPAGGQSPVVCHRGQ